MLRRSTAGDPSRPDDDGHIGVSPDTPPAKVRDWPTESVKPSNLRDLDRPPSWRPNTGNESDMISKWKTTAAAVTWVAVGSLTLAACGGSSGAMDSSSSKKSVSLV